MDENSFPFAYGDNGNYWGFDVELATRMCEKLGWTLQVHVVEKENVYIELYSGNIDCAWGGLALPEKDYLAQLVDQSFAVQLSVMISIMAVIIYLYQSMMLW